MFSDFDLGGSEFQVLPSPVSSPVPPMDLGLSLDLPTFDSSFNFGLDISNVDICSQPSDYIDDIPVRKFELSATIEKKAEPKPKPVVFRPFSSFEALELTVKGLRDRMHKDVQRSYSAPLQRVA